MTPNYCRERCGTFDYGYAAVAHGKFCFCSKTLPDGITPDSNALCNMSCIALTTQFCGGPQHVGVFESITPLTGLQVISDVTGIRGTPTTVTLSITVATGSRLMYMADFDDNAGFTSYNETGFESRELYLPGDYRVQVAANDMDLSFQDTYAVTGFVLEQPVSDVEILCDPAFATHEEGRCEVTVWRGSNLKLDATFPDRSEFDIHLDPIADPIVSMAGWWVPQPLVTASAGVYLMRYALFNTIGKIYGWRLHVNVPGPIDLMILSPYCNAMSYCFETNRCQTSGSCLSSNLTNQHMSTQCSSSDVFCMQNEKCFSSCPTPPARYGTTTINGKLCSRVRGQGSLTNQSNNYWHPVD
ncbi:unnamed protein product [Lymnaea stagnalis]|uniref:WSC domain-containing protein n=1 Tax=Lymnaea stagnalis TaxID=6523 RepID=A0AAV2IC02_LYMST